MISIKYKEAMAEVLCVLKHCDENVIAKIPLDVIKNLKANAIDNENFEEKFEEFYDDVSTLKLRQETIALLAAIYRKYLCTDEERIKFDEGRLIEEQFFEDNRIDLDFSKIKKDKIEVEKNNLPQEIKKANIFTSILNKIKGLFRK